MVRPHRKDGYVHRRRVHIRIDEKNILALDDLACTLGLSRAHLCDLILAIAVNEGGKWLADRITSRVNRALRLRQKSFDKTK